MNDKLSVFISSKMAELRDVRELVAKALFSKGINAWIYEIAAGARPESVVKTSLDEVEAADIYVGLFWEKYGDVTIQEYYYAQSLKKPCFIYIRDKNRPREKKLEDFLRAEIYDLQKGVTYGYFDSAVKLSEQVADDIMAWLVRQHREMTAEIAQVRVSQDEVARLQAEVNRLQSSSYQSLPHGTSVDYLAQQVRGWFKAINYSFENHEVRSDEYFEWIINVPKRRGYDRILVRGIDGEGKVHHVIALRQAVDQYKVDEGWLVAFRRVSQAARDEIEKKNISNLYCYTLDELLDEAINFNIYFDWLEREIKRRGIDTMYVPLACVKEEFDPITKQLIGKSRYDERIGWIDGYIDRWLDDPSKEHISILGEFGTGKTWFTLRYAWIAMQRYREAAAHGVERPRIPLIIPLRDYAKAVITESLFSEFFFRQYEISLPSYSAFEHLNRMGKLLLIFDGFDEMADRVDRQKMINNFWELARVIVPSSKVILTCRTEHFPEAKEGRALLSAELLASTAHLTGKPPQFEILELEYFNDVQIHEVLSSKAKPAVVAQIVNNYQLIDLARRPVMTDFILEALPDIEEGKPVDMSHIYLYAVRRKMERDIKEQRTFTSLADKLYFLCELSWEMLSTNQMSFNFRGIPDRIRRLFGQKVQEQKDLDHWHYDMMGQTMLIRNADGDYTPAHRSLLEFFVAYKLSAELGALNADFTDLARVSSFIDDVSSPQDYTWSTYFNPARNEQDEIVTFPRLRSFIPETIDYLASTFGSKRRRYPIPLLMRQMSRPDGLWHIIKSTCGYDEADVGHTGSNAIELFMSEERTLKGAELAHTVLSGADLEGVDFSEANLYAANLRKANLTDATLQNTDLRKADLTGIILSERNPVTCIYFNPIDNSIAFSSHDRTVGIWHIDQNTISTVFRGHLNSVLQVAFSPNGQQLASAARDRTIRIWDIETRTCRAILKGHNEEVSTVTYSHDGEYIISGSEDGTVIIWRCSDYIQLHKILGLGDVHSVSCSLTNPLVAVAAATNVEIWNYATNQLIASLFNKEARGSMWKQVVFGPQSNLLVVGFSHANPALIDTSTGKVEVSFTRSSHQNDTYYQLSLNLQGDKLACGTYSGKIPIWHVPSGKEILCITHPVKGGKVESVAFDRSGVE